MGKVSYGIQILEVQFQCTVGHKEHCRVEKQPSLVHAFHAASGAPLTFGHGLWPGAGRGAAFEGSEK